MSDDKTIEKKNGAVQHIGNVVLLGSFKAQRNAPPSLLIERINENCRWDVPDEKKCSARTYGFECYRKAQFVVSVTSKGGWCICLPCLGEFCASILERPKAEADEIAAKQIERAQYYAALKEARKAHDEAQLCTGRSNSAPFNLCQRKPVARTHPQHGAIDRYCARHATRVKRWGWKLLPVAS